MHLVTDSNNKEKVIISKIRKKMTTTSLYSTLEAECYDHSQFPANGWREELHSQNPRLSHDVSIIFSRCFNDIYRLLNVYRKIFGTSSYGEDARACECISAI